MGIDTFRHTRDVSLQYWPENGLDEVVVQEDEYLIQVVRYVVSPEGQT